MKLNKNTILQPYGKDELVINLIVSHIGSWTFGLSDVDNIPVYKENALVHGFIHVKAKNPRYYHASLEKDFVIKKQKESERETLNHRIKDAEAIFFFLYYDQDADVIAMNYTCDEQEYEELSEEINIISTYVIFGEDFEFIEQDYSQAVEISRPEVEKAIAAIKEEDDV